MSAEAEISALYPPPPPYYKFFTTENVRKLNELRQSGESNDSIRELVDLKFLIPPIQPDKEQYRSFGDLWWFEDKQVGLKESGIEQIYGNPSPSDKNSGISSAITDDNNQPSVDDAKEQEQEHLQEEKEEEVFSEFRIHELKKMTKSVLMNFLELVATLAKNPSLAGKKIDQIRTILINIHHLLNSYRPHQSRESLILSMQKKLSETKEEIKNIRDTCINVETKLNLLAETKLRNSQTKVTEDANEDIVKNTTSEPSIADLRKEAILALSNKH